MIIRATILTFAFSFVLFAADVPQRTVDDYYFSRPIHTNLTGTIMGYPPAYDVMRYEDIAWLREAACERAALIGRSRATLPAATEHVLEYGTFPLSETNRFSRWTIAKKWNGGVLTTNVIVGQTETIVTNRAFGVDRDETTAWGIDIADGLDFKSPEYYTTYSTDHNVLDVYLSPNDADWRMQSITVRRDEPNYWPTFTNITVDVVTNWSEWFGDTTQMVNVITRPMTNGTTSIHSNVWYESLPRVHVYTNEEVRNWHYYDLMFASNKVVQYGETKPERIRRIPESSQITNWYGYLSGMKRVAFHAYFTNDVNCTVDYWEDTGYMQTIQVSRAPSVSVEGHGNYLYCQRPVNASTLVTLSARPDFTWDVVNVGGHCRIGKAVLYLFARIEYLPHNGDTDKEAYRMWRYGELSPVGDQTNGVVRFSTQINFRSVFDSVATYAQIPVPWQGSSYGYYSADLFITPIFIIVVDFDPWTSLPGFND